MKSDHKILPEKNIFRKYYQSQHDAEQEKLIYKKKLNIFPELLNSGRDQSIRYNDFQHIDCSDLWHLGSIDFSAVARLYATLHNTEQQRDKVICQIDTNPQNIIYDHRSEKYYLIDFVDWRWEYAEFDLIHFLLFWASVKPGTDFLKISQKYIQGYKEKREISSLRWKNIYPEVEEYFDKRRYFYNKNERIINRDISLNRQVLNNLL